MTAGFPDLPIRSDRIQADLSALERFTDPDLPWTRRAFSPQYAASRAWLADRMREAGLDVRVDAAANLIGRRGGAGDRVLMLGSHTDTVEAGGRFDGIVGVVGALEVARCLDEAGAELSLPSGGGRLPLRGADHREPQSLGQPHHGREPDRRALRRGGHPVRRRAHGRHRRAGRRWRQRRGRPPRVGPDRRVPRTAHRAGRGAGARIARHRRRYLHRRPLPRARLA